MSKKKYKRLTQREKDERAALRKRLREEGLLPPRKPSLNRKEFAAQVMAEYKACNWVELSLYLHQAIACMVDENMDRVTSEEIGLLKTLKIALETKRFHERLKAENRTTYKLKDYLSEVVEPIWKL